MTRGDWLTAGSVVVAIGPAALVLLWFLIRFARSEDE